MLVNPIKNGIVIDHIESGNALRIYDLLKLNDIDCPVALITNAISKKGQKKDIIKIDGELEVNLDILGYISPNITINYIKDGVIVDKIHPQLPKELINVVKCSNPRCITSIEQEVDHIFHLTDEENHVYRCIYCESKASR
ncbi:MAG: aspartate carbamoyltransferase regulatory subunit [Erysipelotrichaceae bacterium]